MTETLTPAEFVRQVTDRAPDANDGPTAWGHTEGGRHYVNAWVDSHQGDGWSLEVAVQSKSGTDEDYITIAGGTTLTPAEAAQARDAIANADALLVRRCAEVVAGLGLPEGWERREEPNRDDMRHSYSGPAGQVVIVWHDGRVTTGLPVEPSALLRLLAHAIAGGAR